MTASLARPPVTNDPHHVASELFFFLNLRKLGTAGQKLGGSAALCHIRHDPTDPGGCFTLTAANVGKCQAILCRDGKPLPMSLLHNVGLEEEYRRIRQHRAIITEVRSLLRNPRRLARRLHLT